MALGWPSVELMLAGMSAEEYSYWVEYFSIEPFPELRQDIRTAEIVQAIIALGGKKPPSIEELLPDWWDESRRNAPDSPKVIESKMKMLAAVMPGKFKTGKLE